MRSESAANFGIPRIATVDDASFVAGLLDAFNNEFDTPTPGVDVLAARLVILLQGTATFAVLAGSPPVGLALVTLRPNVWFDGPVALLDELYVTPTLRGGGIGGAIVAAVEAECVRRSVEYVEINVDEGDADARRFYERLGYHGVDEATGEPALYYWRELPR